MDHWTPNSLLLWDKKLILSWDGGWSASVGIGLDNSISRTQLKEINRSIEKYYYREKPVKNYKRDWRREDENKPRNPYNLRPRYWLAYKGHLIALVRLRFDARTSYNPAKKVSFEIKQAE